MCKEKNVKLVGNKGWAFSEESDLRNLEKLAKEGWILKSLARGGYYYRLEKEEPQNLQYNLDCFQGKKEEWFEYLEMFEMAGWQAVCSLGKGSAGTYTIFKAPEGTTPIYSDTSSLLENYKTQKISSLKGLVISIITYLLFGFFNLLLLPSPMTRILSFIFVGISFLSFLFGTICLMMSIVFGMRERKGHEVKFPNKIVWPVIIVASLMIGGLVGGISGLIGFWSIL